MCCGKGGRRGIYKAAATLGVRARVWKTGAGSAGDRGRSSLRERGIREEEDRADRWGPGAARRGERERGAAGGWDRQFGRARRARCGRRWAAARSRAGLKRSRPGGARASWAEVRDAGEAGSAWARAGLGRARVLAWERVGLGFSWVLGFLSFFFFYFFSFLISNSNKFEFKFEFEFKLHSNKSMLQHECHKNLNLWQNFNTYETKFN